MNKLNNQNEIGALIDQGAIFYVSHSGGKDSQAMYAHIREHVPHDQIRVVHADLGDVEWSGVQDHIRYTVDHEILIAQAIHKDGRRKDFFSAVMDRRQMLDRTGRQDTPAMPSNVNRFCTSDLKTGPIWKAMKHDARANLESRIIVNCVGIRGAESPRRQKTINQRGTLNLNKKNSNKTWTCYDYWPIADWHCRTDHDFDPTTMNDDVFGAIAQAGQEPHPAYAAGNDRLSCMFCIFGSTSDLKHAARANPGLLARYIKLEQDSRSTMFNGQSIKDKVWGELTRREQAQVENHLDLRLVA
jgi:3'-phosphoadenosine 5'-phosphosulfate sulfotransferase (PAPS reductase)/FAD synthetase